MNTEVFTQELTRELTVWQSLIGLLEEEEKSLVLGDSEKLSALNEAKLVHVQEINGFVHARNTFLGANQFSPDNKGMTEWISRHGQGHAGMLWQQLRGCENRARNLNERIGILINMRLTSTRQALNVLLAHTGNQGGGYTNEGMAAGPSGGRTLTSA